MPPKRVKQLYQNRLRLVVRRHRLRHLRPVEVPVPPPPQNKPRPPPPPLKPPLLQLYLPQAGPRRHHQRPLKNVPKQRGAVRRHKLTEWRQFNRPQLRPARTLQRPLPPPKPLLTPGLRHQQLHNQLPLAPLLLLQNHLQPLQVPAEEPRRPFAARHTNSPPNKPQPRRQLPFGEVGGHTNTTHTNKYPVFRQTFHVLGKSLPEKKRVVNKLQRRQLLTMPCPNGTTPNNVPPPQKPV